MLTYMSEGGKVVERKKELDNMKLQFKKGHEIFQVTKGKKKPYNGSRFIDIMGYRFYCYNTRVTLRRKTYKRLRRCALRAIRDLKEEKQVKIERARRIVSLLGRLIETDYFKLKKELAICFYRCKGVISNYEKSKIYH